MPTLRRPPGGGNHDPGVALHLSRALVTAALVLSASGCGEPPSGGPAAARAGSTHHSVRVERGTTVLAAFGGARASAVLDGSHLTIELGSPDGLHRLAIEVDGSTPGVYPLARTFESAKAVILLVSHGAPARVSPAEGELRLSASAVGRYSGSFVGRGTDANGYRYRFEGRFDDIPVRRL